MCTYPQGVGKDWWSWRGRRGPVPTSYAAMQTRLDSQFRSWVSHMTSKHGEGYYQGLYVIPVYFDHTVALAKELCKAKVWTTIERNS